MAAGTVRTAGRAGAVHLLNVLRLRLLTQRRGGTSTSQKAHAAGVESVCISADGRFLLTAGDDKAVKVSRLARLHKIWSSETITESPRFVRSGACRCCDL